MINIKHAIHYPKIYYLNAQKGKKLATDNEKKKFNLHFVGTSQKKCVHSVRHPPVSEVSCCVSNDGITLCNVKATKHDSNPAVT